RASGNGSHFVGHGVDVLLARARHHDCGPFAREAERDGPADPSTGAGDDRDATFERHGPPSRFRVMRGSAQPTTGTRRSALGFPACLIRCPRPRAGLASRPRRVTLMKMIRRLLETTAVVAAFVVVALVWSHGARGQGTSGSADGLAPKPATTQKSAAAAPATGTHSADGLAQGTKAVTAAATTGAAPAAAFRLSLQGGGRQRVEAAAP